VPRALWKGAISFGLVHVPVALYAASQDTGIDFDWLDKRSMDPVGYKRINKRTGKEIDRENIVRGLKQGDGEYVVMSDEEIKAAYPLSTQTIEIEAFVAASEIGFTYLEKPYFLAPVGKGAKVYALLREAMSDAGVIGIARVVMHTKEHLAALIADGDALLLNTIRWASELRSRDDLDLPAAGKRAAQLKDAELKMARQLIDGMTTPWQPEDYADRFTEAIHALAAKRRDAGQTEQVTSLEGEASAPSRGNVVDLTALLRQSLETRRAPAARAPPSTAAKKSPRKAAAKKTAAAAKDKRGSAATAKATKAAGDQAEPKRRRRAA